MSVDDLQYIVQTILSPILLRSLHFSRSVHVDNDNQILVDEV